MPGTGFVSITDYLGANQGTLDRERAALQGQVGGEVGTAQADAQALFDQAPQFAASQYGGDPTTMPGYAKALDDATKAQTDVTALGTQGGVASLLDKQQYGDQAPAKPSEASAFDASLIGGQKTPDEWGGLTNYLNQGLNAAESVIAQRGPSRPPSKPQPAAGAPAPLPTRAPFPESAPQTIPTHPLPQPPNPHKGRWGW